MVIGKQTDRWTVSKTDGLVSGQTIRETNDKTGGEKHIQMDSQANRWAGQQTDR